MLDKYLNKSSMKENVNTFVGEGIELTSGNVKGCGSVRIEGIMTGNVDIDGDLFVGEAGYIKGNANANYAHILGRVEGSVFATGLLHLTQSANVQGDIGCSTIIIEKGAVFCGSCRMSGKIVERPHLVVEKKERSAL